MLGLRLGLSWSERLERLSDENGEGEMGIGF